MATSAGATQPSQGAASFRTATRGAILQQLHRVPLSGVVLFEPTGAPQGGMAIEQVGANQRCNQDAIGNNQNETPICASPANTNNVLAGSNDYRNGDASAGFYRTMDGGTTWADALVTRGPSGQFEAAGDPVTAVDNTGRMFAAYIGFDRTTPDNGIYVHTSTDNGSTWTGPVTVIQHLGGGNSDFEDKPYAACDASAGSPFLNNYYITWTKFTTTGLAPIYMARSTNGGASFSTPLQISSSTNCQFSCPTVGPNGEVYACWFDYTSSSIKFDRSTNGGVSWGTDVSVSSFNDNFPANPCGTFRAPAYPVIACDVSSGPRRGWIYVCWADARNGNPDIFFSRSTNGGTSWSAAARVDNDVTNRWQWWQWIATSRVNGDVGVSWLDRREDPAGCTFKNYATISSDGGTTWAPNFAVSSVTSNPSSSNFLGDYCGATFRSSGFYSVWVDLRNDGGDVYNAWWTLSPTLTLTAPNGGETWLTGDADTITWSSANFTDNVKLELNRSYPGATWETIVASTPNSGSFPWTVTGPTSSTARVRISGVTQTTVGDTSNANFTLGARSLTVVSPNGAEIWIAGDANSITWTSANLSENVKIELNRSYPGATWETLVASTANTGSFPWTVTTPLSTACRVRITGVTHTTVGDSSNTNFAISSRAVTVTSPNGGENWLTGSNANIAWTPQNLTGTVMIELNRSYPAGTWETLAAGQPVGTPFLWTVTTPISTTARVRVTSENFPLVTDISDANFSISLPNQPPIILHDPLHDMAPGAGSITSRVSDPSLVASVASVKMFFRISGGSSFDSLTLTPTVNPSEYAASLAAFGIGSFEYYLRSTDNTALASYLPSNAPASLFQFDVDNLCAQELVYDDGSAERFNWTDGNQTTPFQWAVKFTPPPGSYVLCGARFAASRSLPDSAHSPVHVAVYAADGPLGMPGTILWQTTTGSVGNVVGGLPAGTNWSEVLVRDAFGQPLPVTSPFYIALSNPVSGQYEAFGRDISSPNAHHSYVFDGCLSLWFSEDDTTTTINAHPGNRLVRAQYYSALPPAVVINRVANTIVLNWTNLAAPNYRVSTSTSPAGPFAFVQSTTDTFLTVSTADTSGAKLFYQVTTAKP
jgi:hypothetical protein